MSDWFGFFALLSLPPSDLDVFVVCTTSSVDLTVCVTLMLSKDILGGTGTILLLLFLLFLLLETGRLQKTRGVESLLACIGTYSSLLSGLWGLSIWLEACIEGFAYLQYLPPSTRKKGNNNNNTTLSIHSQIPKIPPSPSLLNPHPMPPNPLHPPRRKATNIQQLLQLPISQNKFLLHHKPSHSLRTRRSRQRTTIRPISPLFLHQFLPNILPH